MNFSTRMRACLLAFICGIALAGLLPALPLDSYLLLIRAALCTATGLAVGLLLRTHVRSCLIVRNLLPTLACLLVGTLYGVDAGMQTRAHMLLAEYEQELFEVEGFVVGIPTETKRYGRPRVSFDLSVSASKERVSVLPLRRLRLSWYSESRPQAGERWLLRVKVKQVRGLANRYGFDYQLYLHRSGIDGVGTVKYGRRLQAASPISLPAMRAQLAADFSAHEQAPFLRFARALALGDGKVLTPKDWDLLRQTGTSHLFVVSGLHIGLTAGLMFSISMWLIRFLPAKRLNRFLAALSALVFAATYCAFTGFGLPAQRALMMASVSLCCAALARSFPLHMAFLLALATVLVVDPLAVRSASLFLSFGAVLALLYGFAHRPWRRPGALSAVLRAQYLSFIALLPILLYWFADSPLLMPLANMVAVPFVSFLLLPMSLLSAMLLALDLDAGMLLVALDALVAALLSYLELLLELPLASLQLPALQGVQLFAALLCSLLLLSPRALRMRALAPLMLVPVVFGFSEEARVCPRMQLVVHDVGQGLAISVEVGEKTLLYDTGVLFSERFDMGSAVLVPYFRHRGRRPDVMMLSHADLDHSGGAAAVLNAFPDTRIIGSQLQDMPYALGRDWQQCQVDQGWQWSGVQFAVLHPAAGSTLRGNNASCVLRISHADWAILISGDIEAAGEQQLLANYSGGLSSDVLIVPHHGSKTSSSRAFLEAVRPRYAVVSAGYKNSFGHPAKGVQQRYQAIGARLLNTADAGALSVSISLCNDHTDFEIHRQRGDSAKYWLAW